VPLSLTRSRWPSLPLALVRSRTAHGPPYSGSRRLLNTPEGFQSAAKDLHAYMGTPRGRSNTKKEGGAGEEGPLPDAWAGPEVDSVGKMYIEDFGANRQKPPCTPPKMSPNQGPRNEGPKPEAEQHALLDKQRIRFPPCARQNRRHHPTPNVEAARFKTNKPHYASGVYHLQCCPSWVTSHKLGIYPLDWDWLWSSFRRAAARKPLRDPRWLPARWLLGKMAPS
jgi:hypothetical protein